MPEEIALTQAVERPAAIQELDRASADHAHMLHRPFLLAEDRRAGGEELHLGRLRKFLQVALGEVVERSVPPQELDYVVHRGANGSLPDCPAGRQLGPGPGDAGVASGDRRVRASPPRS